MHRHTELLVTALALAWLCPATASALFGDSDDAIGLDGSFRSMGGLTINYDDGDDDAIFGPDNDADGFGQSLLRVELAGYPTDALRYELHGLQSMSMTSADAATGPTIFGGAFALPTGSPRYRALDLRWDQIEDADLQAAMDVDRAAVTVSWSRLDLTVGRQAITVGHTHLWNPTDLYLRWDPSQFDRDYKPGVDAVRVDLAVGDFSGLTVVGVAGRSLLLDTSSRRDGRARVSWYGSSALLRAFTLVEGFDLSAQGGKVYGGYHAAGGLTGELSTIELRAEAAYFIADDGHDDAALWPLSGEPLLEDHLQAVGGIGRGFDSGLLLEAEYLYNGAAGDDTLLDFMRTFTGLSPSVTAHVLGATASYPISALWHGSLLALVSLVDGSVQVMPVLVYSVSDESEFIAGAFLNFGERPESSGLVVPEPRSEYGTSPSGGMFEFKLYF